jgi:hypothetical protein
MQRFQACRDEQEPLFGTGQGYNHEQYAVADMKIRNNFEIS